MTALLHEDFDRRGPVQPGSNRAFGLVMATAFALLAGIQFWRGRPAWPAPAAVAAIFASAAWLTPVWLAPLSRGWFRLGLVLHNVVSPITMGLLFFGVVTPVGVLMRWCGRRPLAQGFDAVAASYWAPRAEPTAPARSMTKQY